MNSKEIPDSGLFLDAVDFTPVVAGQVDEVAAAAADDAPDERWPGVPRVRGLAEWFEALPELPGAGWFCLGQQSH